MIQPKRFKELSYDEAKQLWRTGYMTDRQFEQFHVMWTWGAYRFSSPKVDKFHEKHGYAAVVRRINRVRKVLKFEPYNQR